MKKHFAPSITLFLNLIIVLTTVSGAVAQSPPGNERVFPTGFSVRGEFLDFSSATAKYKFLAILSRSSSRKTGVWCSIFIVASWSCTPRIPPNSA